MLPAVGIDSVEIARFAHWHQYSDMQLLRMFSAQEIAYCRAQPVKSAERFAVRFAAKEAFLKACSASRPNMQFHLLRVCRAVQVCKYKNGAPYLDINLTLLGRYGISFLLNNFYFSVSLTHTDRYATAIVMMVYC